MARILIVEDEDCVRQALRELLQDVGHEVIEASNGEQGVSLYRKSPTDIVITDLIMPRFDGTEAIRHIRRTHPDAKIIAVSGRGGDQMNANLTRSAMLGADRTLPKPFVPTQLVDLIEQLLRETPSALPRKAEPESNG